MRDRVMELIQKKATEENVSVVIVEHDLNVIWSLSSYVHFMAEGSVVLRGDPSNKEIANELVIGEKTVKTHVSNILMKLGLSSRTQAALHAVRIGLVSQ